VKKFLVTQKFESSADTIAAAFASEATWRSFAGLPFVGDPVVQSFEADESVEIAVAYQVSIDLPPLADKFIDPDKLTFVEKTTLNSEGSGTFTIVPDHYSKLLTASGRIEMVPYDGGWCERLIQGSVNVDLGWTGKLFEGPVEEAIVTGLKEALRAQAAQVHTP